MTKRHCHGWPSAPFPLLAILAVCLAASRSRAEDRRDGIGKGPPPPPAVTQLTTASVSSADSASIAADAARLAMIRTALNPLVIRDRRHRLLLKRGDEALRCGDIPHGLAHFQALLDAPQDAFSWKGKASQLLGTQSHVLLHFQTLPATVRELYELHQGPAARELLTRFGECGDRRLLVELCRRFGHTAAARDAAIEQMLLARDAGRIELAAEWGRLLAADTYHWERLPAIVRRLVIQHVEETNESPTRTATTVSQRLPHRDTLCDRDGLAQDISPPYPVPLWAARFDAGIADADASPGLADDEAAIAPMIAASVDDWLTDRIEERLPIASANEAIVADETLIVRDFARLCAFELATGERLWTYDCRSSLAARVKNQLEHPDNSSNGGVSDFDALFAENPVFGRLATDGNRVFLLDRVDPAITNGPSSAGPNRSSSPSPHRPNQLIALDIEPPSPAPGCKSTRKTAHKAPLWTRGAQSTHVDDPLARHVFLGRPLYCDDRLFVLAEFDRQISLIALEAETGATLWSQAVALVGQMAAVDTHRTRIACSPLYSDGIVICPTEVGIVVGVDALTGRLRWVYDHLDDDQRTNAGRGAFSPSHKSNRTAICKSSFVHRGRFIHLPSRSESVHCIDARTGAGLWKSPRLDSHAIGGVTDGLVLLLGDRECRALDLNDAGQQLWQTAIPEPAGFGLVSADRYYLPTSDGPCLTLDLQTGQIVGRPFHRLLYDVARNVDHDAATPTADSSIADNRPVATLANTLHTTPAGNLLATGDLIVASTPLGISVFRQSRAALDRITAIPPHKRSYDDRLKLAELELTLGQPPAARRILANLLVGPDAAGSNPSAERLLREILYAELDHSDRPLEILDRIAALSRTDDQRLRLILRRIDVAIAADNSRLLVDAVRQFQSLPPTGLMAVSDGYLVSPSISVWEKLARLRQQGTLELRQALAAEVARTALQLQGIDDPQRLEQFVTLFAGWESVAPAQIRLARWWAETGRHQQAESLLLSGRFSPFHEPTSEQAHTLAQLYAHTPTHTPTRVNAQVGADLPPSIPAAQNSRSASPTSGDSATHPRIDSGITLVSLKTASSPAPLDSPLSALRSPPTVEITQHVCSDQCSHAEDCPCIGTRRLHASVRRRFFPDHSHRLVLLDRGTSGENKNHSRLAIADRLRQSIHATIDLPAAYWPQPRSLSTRHGHVVVIGGETAFALSLLEGRLLWSRDAAHAGKKQDKFNVGPVGPDFCVLQSSRALRVVHPATGQTLWCRTDLRPGVGLEANDEAGIIGDTETLAVFDADQTAFTLYHTLSGQILSRGVRPQSDAATCRARWAVGCRLAELVSTEAGAQFQVWNSRTDRIEWDIPLTERLLCPLPGDREFACITADGRFKILNVAEERLCLDVALPPSTPAASPASADARVLTVFADPQRFYVNLVSEGHRRAAETALAEDHLSFPKLRVRGRLLAIDRQTPTILWDRHVDDACLPLCPQHSSEMLVLIRQEAGGARREIGGGRPGAGGGSPEEGDGRGLVVEVLDASSGQTLARRDGLALEPLVDCQINPGCQHAGCFEQPGCFPTADGRLNLCGLRSQVSITLTRSPARPLIRTASPPQPSTTR